MKNCISIKKKIVVVGIICICFLLSGFHQCARGSTEVTGITAFEERLVGSDGKGYRIYGQSDNIIYGIGGSTSLTKFNSDLNICKFTVESDAEAIGYCIEWGVGFESDKKYVGQQPISSNYYRMLPDDVKEGIRLVALYGWQHGKILPMPIGNEDDYYFATQVIIWEYQQNLRKTPNTINSRSGMPSDYFSKSLKDRPAEKYYYWILDNMKEHKSIPSFFGQAVHTMKYDGKTADYRTTLVDENKVNFILPFNDNDIRMERTGSNYTFITKTPFDNVNLKIKKQMGNPSSNWLIWGNNANGQVMMTGTEDNLAHELSLRTEKPGLCRIIKTSEDGLVEGITFEIAGENFETKAYVTDEEGVIETDLFPGKYKVKEKVKDRYLPMAVREVEIMEGETAKVSFVNKLKRGDVEISKTDFSTGKPIPGCGIEILDHSMKKIFSGKTNEKGIIAFKNLPIGKYFYREIDPPKGYLLDKKSYAFEILENHQIVKCSMTNERVPEVVEAQPPVKTGGSSNLGILYVILAISATIVLMSLYALRKN